MVVINKQPKISRKALIGIKIAVAVYLGIALVIVLSVLITFCSASTSSALYIYMCGSSLESSQGIASRNITELLEADVPPNMTIIIQTGGASKWRSHDIPSGKIARYQIKNHELVELETCDQASMGSESTFSDFVSFASKNYPARKKMLVVWDHGGGTLQGACFDENFSNDKLTLPEMEKGLESGLVGEKFFAVGFDACLMADLEVARAIASSSDMLIASQAVENGEGWDYAKLVSDFAHMDNSSSFGKSVCDAYFEKCKRVNKEAPATLSAIDLSAFDKVNEAFDELGRGINEDIDEIDTRSSLLYSMLLSGSYGLDKSGRGGNLYDLSSFSRNLNEYASGDIAQQAEVLENELNKAIMYNKTGTARQDATGLSIYYPLHYSSTEVKDYLSINQSEPWNTLVSKMYTRIPEETIVFDNNGSIEDGTFFVNLSPSSCRYLKEARYILIHESGERPVPIPIRFDLMRNLALDNTRINAHVPTTMFTFNGFSVPATQIDASNNTETYTILFMHNDRIDDFRFVRVREGDAWRCYPVGIVHYDESVGAPGKDYIQLNEGETVHVNGKDIKIGAEGVVIKEEPLQEGRYTYQIFCGDIFGKELASRIVEMEYREGEWKTLYLKD